MKLHQKTLKTRLLPAALAVSALVVAGCGGGGGGGSAEPPPPTPVPTTSISGIVLDGPLENAKVCIDLNDNRACDTDEPSTMTSATGAYTLEVPEGSESLHPVLAEATAGTTIDADTGPVAGTFVLMAPAGLATVISPYTTLVQSELDSGRSGNRIQAEENLLASMVGTLGDTGGLTLYSNFQPDETDATSEATKRAKMAGLAQLLTRAFAKTQLDSGLTGKELSAALGQVAAGSLQRVLALVNDTMTADAADALFANVEPSLVPSADHLADVRKAQAKTAAEPIEGVWVRTVDLGGGVTAKHLLLLAGDGTFVHQTLDPGVDAATSTAFDDGYGYRYGRYEFSGSTLTTSLIEASTVAGPGNGSWTGVSVSGNTLTADGGITYTRVASADNPLVGGWVRPDGSTKPEFLVMFGDGTYFHSSFYFQNDPKTGTASTLETAKSAGTTKGTYTANGSQLTFGTTEFSFNGTLSVPSNPGVGTFNADGTLSMTGLRLVKLGTPEGARAVTGLSEATRATQWVGRYFSRTTGSGNSAQTQYIYVRGINDVVSFMRGPSGGSTSVPCTVATAPFSSVLPDEAQLKQYVIGTSIAASAGYAQRRLNIGLPGAGNFVTYTPAAPVSNNTARCEVPT